MEIKIKDPKDLKLKKDRVLVLPFFEGKKPEAGNIVLDEGINFSGGEFRFVSHDKGMLLLANVGKDKIWTRKKYLLGIRKIIRFLKNEKASRTDIYLDGIVPAEEELGEIVRQTAENILIADYDFTRYKEKPKGGWPEMKSVNLVLSVPNEAKERVKEGIISGSAVNLARDFSNIPGGEMTPKKLASLALKELKGFKSIKTEVFGKKKIEDLGMGGIMAVSRGSGEEPKFLVMKYFGKRNPRNIDLVYVGKGLTFDSGGLNIKPGESMLEMHMDMSGGASVIAAIKAAAELEIRLNIVGIVPAAENMLSGYSFRPGDILKSYSGKMIEIVNTDAEGRLILADALSYGIKRFKPRMIVDIATLTGAAEVALGRRASALFTNKEEIEADLRAIGDISGDYVWPLPCWDDYQEEIKGVFGDILNSGVYKGRGGAITAAVFLKNFVGDVPWIHLDIAPTMTSIDNQGLAKGSTGFGVRYLLELARRFPKMKL